MASVLNPPLARGGKYVKSDLNLASACMPFIIAMREKAVVLGGKLRASKRATSTLTVSASGGA